MHCPVHFSNHTFSICSIQKPEFSDPSILNSGHFSIPQSFNWLTPYMSHTWREAELQPWLRFSLTIIVHLQQKQRFHGFVTAANGCACALIMSWVIHPPISQLSEWLVSGVPCHTSSFTQAPSCSFPVQVFLCMNRKNRDNQSHDHILSRIKRLSTGPHLTADANIADISVRAGCSRLPFSQWREIGPNSSWLC